MGDPGDPLGKGSRSADPTEARASPHPGLPVTPACRPQHSPKRPRAHVSSSARAHTHTHTHTHTQHRLACLHTRVPVLRLSPSGLCTPCLHDLTFRQNNTQGARLPVSPRSTPPPPPRSRPPEPAACSSRQENKRGPRAACRPGGQPCPADARRRRVAGGTWLANRCSERCESAVSALRPLPPSDGQVQAGSLRLQPRGPRGSP